MIIAGAVLLVIAVGCFFWARHQRKKLEALASTETLPCNKLEVDQACEVVGKAQAGPAGVLKGPASGRECVWWHHKVTEHWEDWDTDSNGNRRKTDRSNTLKDERSSEIFALKDDAGQVLVSVAGANIDDPIRSHSVRSDKKQSLGGEIFDAVFSDREDTEIEVEEWILPVGQQLFVRGQPTDAAEGLMMVDPGEHFLISTRSGEELEGSAKLWAKVATIATAVAAVAGVALLIAGALAG